ncbi:preprotein translocase subunit SecE [Candidatus Roizmanbacteria bacterium RIFCSPHIGHO2_02_FULL_37_13b]|uniref:Protein translocase subunit SecE n=1 Tax=Candidatus Roizmanbacteria bacterium RIFCSPLOWO2_02_FULL_36_11 TaxID=1802071 RepID=A0A1F7JBR1_9BACT|nr:MAG: preprotein translocase subunit SecE [Candidatus Roizmanbacteria bacterium RIFCSPHIGHO2_02_FULL_37_13b]OGK53064.1 MAG: preprotein translocase subunit SecE [Candidatus Roizmanbacteria bacterium RIFCSPLOWO2_02_FULL_36_11]
MMEKTKTLRSFGFVGDIRDELKKVTWPTRTETIKLTVTVFAISLIVGLYVGIIDVVLAKVLQLLTKI